MNTFKPIRYRATGAYPPRQQRGVVLLFALIAVTVMLIGAVALISSFNTSLVTAGNIGFKRDLSNQVEKAISEVMLKFEGSGALSTTSARGATKGAHNYSATALTTNSQGIPLDLLKKTADFNSASPTNWTGADLDPGQGIKIRYLVDRLCSTAGDAHLTLAPEACIRGGKSQFLPAAGDESRMRSKAEDGGAGVAAAVPLPVAYRVTVRATGPRNTEAFYQVTFTEPLPPPSAIPTTLTP
jgi:type IV pilus assembly protein PilX